jgi:hypothetical protein
MVAWWLLPLALVGESNEHPGHADNQDDRGYDRRDRANVPVLKIVVMYV